MAQSSGLGVIPSAAAPEPHHVLSAWEKLTRPHPAITDLERRRQSQLLAGLILAMLISTTAGSILLIIGSGRIPATVLLLLPAQLFTLALYFLNRRGFYGWSASLFVGFNFLLVHFASIITNDLGWSLFASMMLLLSASFMPFRVTLRVFAVSIALQVVLALVQPIRTEISNVGTLTVFLITGSLVIVFMNHRSGLENERQAELRQMNQRLRESEAALEQRVLDRTRDLSLAMEETEAAWRRTEEADRVKTQFLASMSHELRTPLNAILTFTELISMGTFGPVNEEQVDYLQKSLTSGKHLLSLINDVLDMSKIQAGMLKLFIEDDFEVTKEVGVVVASAEKLLRDKPVQLVLDIDPHIPNLRCDKRRIRQVLLNLLSNAIKFTDTGTITLSAKKRENEVLFAVIDTGPGISQDQQDIVFEPFIQTETGIRHAGGTGLGLPISKQIVEAHQGRLWVESAPGEGAAFFVTLPLHSEMTSGK